MALAQLDGITDRRREKQQIPVVGCPFNLERVSSLRTANGDSPNASRLTRRVNLIHLLFF